MQKVHSKRISAMSSSKDANVRIYSLSPSPPLSPPLGRNMDSGQSALASSSKLPPSNSTPLIIQDALNQHNGMANSSANNIPGSWPLGNQINKNWANDGTTSGQDIVSNSAHDVKPIPPHPSSRDHISKAIQEQTADSQARTTSRSSTINPKAESDVKPYMSSSFMSPANKAKTTTALKSDTLKHLTDPYTKISRPPTMSAEEWQQIEALANPFAQANSSSSVKTDEKSQMKPFVNPNTPKAEASSSNPKPEVKAEHSTIDLTNDQEDEITFVDARGPGMGPNGHLIAPDPNQIICVGLICASFMSPYGLPQSLTVPIMPNRLEDINAHPRWNKNEWPRGAEFYLEAGYRPVELTARRTNKNEVLVHDLLAPHDNNGIPQVRREHFGELVSKHSNALCDMLLYRRMRIAARVRVVNRLAGAGYIHAIELLCFIARKDAHTFSRTLLQNNIQLNYPARYDPLQFEFEPPLEVPSVMNRFAAYSNMNALNGMSGSQAPYDMFGAYGSGFGAYNSSGLNGFPGMPMRGSLMPTKEETEEERRKQVDAVYSSLPDGETLELTEVDKSIIVTPLMEHQKRALTFLLDHEEMKSFDKEGEEDQIVSLWKARRQGGRIISYKNVVTMEVKTQKPRICRGAILADDMGLGKTLSAISLIASTHEEARDWSKEPILSDSQPESKKSLDSDDSDIDILEDFNMNIPGLPSSSAKKLKQNGTTGQKKIGKRAAQKVQIEKIKKEQIKTRTRATLIVLPLTLVSAWEEQIRLHWASDKKPKIYVHHGSNRLTDPKKIARHNIVMTTYSTLASEYSILTADDSSEEEEDEGDEDDVLVTDEKGEVIGRRLTAAEKATLIKKKTNASKKRKRKAEKRKRLAEGEGFPLQQIEWFRIILDEAHTIKESRTLQSRAACHLLARSRICLTGTPVQNRIQDLFALVKFLRLEPFDELQVWNRVCSSVDSKIGLNTGRRPRSVAVKDDEPLDSTAMKSVQTIMKFLTLRRTKDMRLSDGRMLLELPPKYGRTVQLEFDQHERAAYNEMRQMYKDEFEEMKKNDTLKYNYASILHEISNLRMTCDHIELVESNKDNRMRKENKGDEDADALIKREGISRDRAIRFFEVLCSSDKAECAMCHYDLSAFADESSRQESPIDDGMGGGVDRNRGKKPVLTHCAHLLCSDCLQNVVSVGGDLMGNIDEETKIACPDCGIVIAPLTEVRTLVPGDIEKKGNVRNVLTKETFGADIGIPIDERSNQSTKIRALIEDLEFFSKSNRKSKIYDRTRPALDQVAADATEKEAGREEVYITEAAPDSKPIKSVVFSQWTSMLDRVARAVHRAGIKFATLDGRMTRQERNENLEKFKFDPSVEVFLISLKAGGVGLNLVSACRAYLLEPYWNPATENQGLDRVHRMGQVRPVVTTKYIVERSIEENMLELQRLKMELAESVGGKRRTLNREQELNILFSDRYASSTNRNQITDGRAGEEESSTESEGAKEGAE